MSRHSGHIYRDITGFFILIPVGILFVNSKKKLYQNSVLARLGKVACLKGLSEVISQNQREKHSVAAAPGCFACQGCQQTTLMGNPIAQPISGG